MAFTFAWTRVLVERRGWKFEVFSEPDPVLLANVRFLAGYRRSWQFDAGLLGRILADPLSFEQVERAVSAGEFGRSKVRSHLPHLLWSGRVCGDFGRPLSESMVLEAS